VRTTYLNEAKRGFVPKKEARWIYFAPDAANISAHSFGSGRNNSNRS
jgi:hypothetical protein